MPGPNIVLILIDDMGQRDLGCYGSTFYETPRIDALARDGMLFTDAYASCPVCSPTRASILTGRYPASLGLTDWIDWRGAVHPARGRLVDVPYTRELPEDLPNLATELKRRGYATWHVGKWHLGGEGSWPESRGFEVNAGGWTAGMPYHGYFSPWKFPTLQEAPDGTYLTDHLTDRAISLVENRDPDRPFFLNLWHYAVHTPIQAPEHLVRKYERKAALLGLDRVDPFVTGASFPAEHKKEKRIERRIIQSDPIYAAMIESLDANVGRLLDAIETSGVAENTIVILTSDNGGLSTAEGSPTCNHPLAEGKGWMYEGGTREPLLVRWPERVPRGTRSNAVVTSTDFFPTLLEVAGGDSPPDNEGESILPILTRERDSTERAAVYWHYPHYGNQGGTPGSSARSGRYKLIEFFESGRLELYDLETDPGEWVDLSTELPDVRSRLHALLTAWRESVEARIPQPNPDFVPWPGRAGESRHLEAGIAFE